jgi:hypothetical protein
MKDALSCEMIDIFAMIMMHVNGVSKKYAAFTKIIFAYGCHVKKNSVAFHFMILTNEPFDYGI